MGGCSNFLRHVATGLVAAHMTTLMPKFAGADIKYLPCQNHISWSVIDPVKLFQFLQGKFFISFHVLPFY